jgi:four helix bundle protein
VSSEQKAGKMNVGEGFEKLEVWKKACRLVVDVYKAFSECKDFGFKDQICRAAVSVPSNTAEGYERNSPRDFVRFLNIAKGSIGELRTQLYIARELGYLEKEIFEDLLERSKEISAMLAGLIKTVGKKF